MKSRPIGDGFSVVDVRSEEGALMHFREESKPLPALFFKTATTGTETLSFDSSHLHRYTNTRIIIQKTASAERFLV